MSKKAEFSEDQLRKIAEQKIIYKRSVRIHWLLYMVVNILLGIINLLIIGIDVIINTPPDVALQVTVSKFWVLYPAFGWLIGLMMHTMAYLMYANGVYPMAKRGVIFHFTAYIMVNLLLTVINFMTLPTFYWVFFPAVFWGAGFVVHFIVYMVYWRGKIDEKGEAKSKKERAIEKEMQKMRKKMNK